VCAFRGRACSPAARTPSGRWTRRPRRRACREQPPVRMRCERDGIISGNTACAVSDRLGICAECASVRVSRPHTLTCAANSARAVDATIVPLCESRATACKREMRARSHHQRTAARHIQPSDTLTLTELEHVRLAAACAHLRRRLRPSGGSDDPDTERAESSRLCA
jgi:hypothetical protein